MSGGEYQPHVINWVGNTLPGLEGRLLLAADWITLRVIAPIGEGDGLTNRDLIVERGGETYAPVDAIDRGLYLDVQTASSMQKVTDALDEVDPSYAEADAAVNDIFEPDEEDVLDELDAYARSLGVPPYPGEEEQISA